MAASEFLFKTNDFTIDAYFELKNSIIVGSYPIDSDTTFDANAVHIQSGGENIIPGSSLKGAIRARAERILNTLACDRKDKKKRINEIFEELFGIVELAGQSRKVIRSRVRIEESRIPKVVAEMKSRIRIDRFTGGTIEGALFNTVPLFRKGEVIDFREEGIHLTITIQDYQEHEVGLLLLVLKDLWTGDLPIGGEKGVGRGILKGINATIMSTDKESNVIEQEESGLKIKDSAKLEAFVYALVKEF